MREISRTAKSKPTNSVYIPSEIRQQLEKLALAAAFHRGRRISDSSFVQYLISEFGEQAKERLIAEGIPKKGGKDDS